MTRFGLAVLTLLFLWPQNIHAAEITVVKYPHGATNYSLRTTIGLTAVEMALRATEADYGPCKIETSQIPMERKRREATLEKGIDANVLMLPGKNSFDDRFILVPIPLDRGLLGYRIAFVNAQNKDALKDVQNLDDMRQMKGCINSSWNITKIFEHNALKLVYFSRYEALFGAVQINRCEYFSRGIGEIKGEYEHFKPKYPDLAYEPHVLLRTRLANYIYVSKNHPELAERIHEGLKRTIADGSFDTFFQRFYGKDIAELNLKDRRIIHLESPNEHQGAPVDIANYWFGP